MKFLTLVTASFVLASTAACSHSGSSSSSDLSAPIQTPTAPVTYDPEPVSDVKAYDSVEGLFDAADLVVSGTVTRGAGQATVKTPNSDRVLVYDIHEVDVEDAWDADLNDTLLVAWPRGADTPDPAIRGRFGAAPEVGQPVVLALQSLGSDDATVLEIDSKNSLSGDISSEQVYTTVGGAQGIANRNGSNVEPWVESPSSLGGEPREAAGFELGDISEAATGANNS